MDISVAEMASDNFLRRMEKMLDGLPPERGGITAQRAIGCAMALDTYNGPVIDGFDPDYARDMASYLLGRPCKWGD